MTNQASVSSPIATLQASDNSSFTPAQAKELLTRGIEGDVAALRALNLAKRLFELSVFIGLWLVGAALAIWSYESAHGAWWYAGQAVGTLLAAIGLNAFVLLLHEGMHHTLFRHRRANYWVSVLLGGAVLVSFTAYRVLHIRHHTFLGDSRDPDDYHNYTQNRVLLWLPHVVRLAVGAFLYLALIPFLAWRYGSPTERHHVAREYVLLAIAYSIIVLILPQSVLLHGWLIPLVIVAYMTNIRGLTQHGFTESHDPLLASRSMKVNRIVAFCLLNENYHLEHHLFPEIPSYNLQKLHGLIWGQLPRAIVGRSYLVFLARFFAALLRQDEAPIGLTTPSQSHGEGRV